MDPPRAQEVHRGGGKSGQRDLGGRSARAPTRHRRPRQRIRPLSRGRRRRHQVLHREVRRQEARRGQRPGPEAGAAHRGVRVRGIAVLQEGEGGVRVPRPRRRLPPVPLRRELLAPDGQGGGRRHVPVHEGPEHRRVDVRERRHRRAPVSQLRPDRQLGPTRRRRREGPRRPLHAPPRRDHQPHLLRRRGGQAQGPEGEAVEGVGGCERGRARRAARAVDVRVESVHEGGARGADGDGDTPRGAVLPAGVGEQARRAAGEDGDVSGAVSGGSQHRRRDVRVRGDGRLPREDVFALSEGLAFTSS
mmetsp:Transcript_11260/g.45458  ORF Transcript_11260/g.45458 Transcript_11260/m.45458 type:complete len:304 (-) Transcript_11260:75-986(-)